MKKDKTGKRIFRISFAMFVLLLIFNIAGKLGYWIDHETNITAMGLPSFLGSIWFNMVATIFPIFAILLYKKGTTNDATLRTTLFWSCVAISVVAPFFGLFISVAAVFALIVFFSLILGVTALGVLWVISMESHNKQQSKLEKSIDHGVKKAKKTIKKAFWG